MAASIDEARCDVQTAFSVVLSLVDSGAERRLEEVEGKLWTGLLALGRALIVLFLVHQASRPRARDYLRGGVRFSLSEWRSTDLGTKFGKVRFCRPIGRRWENRRAAADLPVDRELGLAGGFSLGVVMDIARLCTMMAYSVARDEYRRVHEWAPSPRAAMRMVDTAGGLVDCFVEQEPAPDDDGEILVIQVDAGGVPMISETEIGLRRQPKRKSALNRTERKQHRIKKPRRRRGPGEKSKNAKMAVVGVIYTLKRTPDGLEGPINKQVFSTFCSHKELFILLQREAIKRGYGQKITLFLGDGCEHIWRNQQIYFEDAECCLDWFHLMEYVWKAARCLFKGKGKAVKKQRKSWVKIQKKRLLASDVLGTTEALQQLLDETAKTGPGNKRRRETLSKVIGYIEANGQRMPYASFTERDFDIGSGAIEGAVRNLVRMRLDGPGMRWGRHRSEHILRLRCILLNGQWARFISYLAKREAVALSPQPAPTQPHTASRKAA